MVVLKRNARPINIKAKGTRREFLQKWVCVRLEAVVIKEKVDEVGKGSVGAECLGLSLRLAVAKHGKESNSNWVDLHDFACWCSKFVLVWLV